MAVTWEKIAYLTSSITDGDTTHAPNGNSVFDALALKLSKSASIGDITTRAHSLLTSLTADDHTQYSFLAGRVGGQTIVGGTAVTDNLELIGTSGNGTLTSAAIKISVGNAGATPALTILNNGNIGVNLLTPNNKFEVDDGAISTIGSYGDILMSSTRPNFWTASGQIWYKDYGFLGTQGSAGLDLSWNSYRALGVSTHNLLDAGSLGYTNASSIRQNNSGILFYTDSGVSDGFTPSLQVTIQPSGNVIFANNISIGGAAVSTTRNINSSLTSSDNSGYGIYSLITVTGTLTEARSNYSAFLTITNEADNTSFANNIYGLRTNITNNNGYGYNSGITSYNLITNNDTSKTNATTLASFNRVTNASTGTLTNAYGLDTEVINDAGGTITIARGIYSIIRNDEGVINTAYGIQSNITQAVANGIITTAYGGMFGVTQTEGTIETAYGMYITGCTGTTAYGLYQAGSDNLNYFAGKVGFGTSVPTKDISLGGTTVKNIGMERHTTANTAGDSLTIEAGGATVGATDKTGGSLILSSGISTGTGISNISFYTSTAGTAGTTDNTQTEKMTLLGSGNLGIGTVNPVQKLDVAGSIQVSANLYMTSSTNGILTTTSDGADTNRIYLSASSGLTTSRGAYVIVYGNEHATNPGDLWLASGSTGNIYLGGSVGIGVIAPVNKLDVEGSVAIGSAYSGTSVATTNGLIVEGKVGFGNIAPLSQIGVTGNASIGATYGIIAAPTSGLIVEGNMGIGTSNPTQNLDVVGNIQVSGALYMSHASSSGIVLTTEDGADTSRIYISGGGALSVTRGASVVAYGNEHATNPGQLILSPGSSSYARITSNLVFIGTAGETPTMSLSLGGTLARTFGMERHATANTAGNSLTINAGGATIAATNKAGGNLILSSGISTGTGGSEIQFWTAPVGTTGTADNAPTQKAVITTAGYLGIGTTTPGTLLHLEKSTNGPVKISINNLTDGTAAYAGIGFDAGNGATTGAISAYPPNYTGFTAFADTMNIWANTAAAGGLMLGHSDGLIKFMSSASVEFMRITSGNLGIGTIVPLSKLSVIGNVSIGATYGAIAAPTSGLIVEGNVGIGLSLPTSQLTQKSTTATQSATLGSELLTSSDWTSTGWTGDFETGFTHTVGNTTALTNTIAAEIDDYYHITFVVTNRTAGSFTVAFGGITSIAYTASSSYGPKAVTTDSLLITPTTDFNGKIVLSLKQITAASLPTYAIQDSTGVNAFEIRNTLLSQYNTFLGEGSGRYNTTGLRNTSVGPRSSYNNTTGYYNSVLGFYALYNNTTGFGNTAIGYQAIYFNINGYNNTAIGLQAIYFNINGYNNTAIGLQASYNNTTGYNNAALGYQALYSNTTGYRNVALGTSSGRYTLDGSSNTNSNISLFLGYDTRPSADGETNQIVIGSSAIGNGSDSVTLGNDSITKTILKGAIGIGTAVPTNTLSFGGNAARKFWMERHTTANTAGNSLTIQSGSATVGATDKAGGQLILVPGLATGTGESGVTVQGCLAGSTGTADGTLQDMIKVLGNKLGFFNATPVVKPSAYTQTYTTASKTVPNATASNPPAGGTGATAGAYDTSAHRDEMITSLTNNIADVLALKKVVNALIDDLQALGIIG